MIPTNLPEIPDTVLDLMGRRDKILPIISKWPIFELDIKDQKGLWIAYQNKMADFIEKDLFEKLNEEIIEDFYKKNSDIEFETLFFDDIFKKNYMFRYKNEMFVYSMGKKSKRSKKIYYVRFFFNLNDFFNY